MKMEDFQKLDSDFQQYLIEVVENLSRETLIEYLPQKDLDYWMGQWQEEISTDIETQKKRVEIILKELESIYFNIEIKSDTKKVDMDKFAQKPIVKKASQKLKQMKIGKDWMHKNGFSTALWLYGEALKIK